MVLHNIHAKQWKVGGLEQKMDSHSRLKTKPISWLPVLTLTCLIPTTPVSHHPVQSPSWKQCYGQPSNFLEVCFVIHLTLFSLCLRNAASHSPATSSPVSSPLLFMDSYQHQPCTILDHFHHWSHPVMSCLRVVQKLSPLISTNCFNWSWSLACVCMLGPLLFI